MSQSIRTISRLLRDRVECVWSLSLLFSLLCDPVPSWSWIVNGRGQITAKVYFPTGKGGPRQMKHSQKCTNMNLMSPSTVLDCQYWSNFFLDISLWISPDSLGGSVCCPRSRFSLRYRSHSRPDNGFFFLLFLQLQTPHTPSHAYHHH